MKSLRTTTQLIIDEIDARDIVIGLTQLAKTAKTESVRATSYQTLAKIKGLLDESAKVHVSNYNNIMDAITDNLGEKPIYTPLAN